MNMASPPGDTVAEPVARESARRPSLLSRLLALLLRFIVRPLVGNSVDLVALRRRLRWIDALGGRGRHVIRRTPLGAIAAEFCISPAPSRVLLYLHGGGFCFPAIRAHRAFVSRLCEELDAAGCMPDYRLAPEYPYPAGLNDCFDSYRALLDQGVHPGSIVVAGDSAGGNLSLALLMRLRDAGLPLPACAVLISPGTDLTGINVHPSYERNARRDALIPVRALPRVVSAYTAGADPSRPLISPLHGDFAGLPPLHFVASDDEVLRDDSRLAATKARAADVDTELGIWRGMFHAFPLFQGLPEARAARADIVRFARLHTVDDAPGALALQAHLLQNQESS